jgi:hypothetical protein
MFWAQPVQSQGEAWEKSHRVCSLKYFGERPKGSPCGEKPSNILMDLWTFKGEELTSLVLVLVCVCVCVCVVCVFWGNVSPSLTCMCITGIFLKCRCSSRDSEVGHRFCSSKKLPGNDSADPPQATLWLAVLQDHRMPRSQGFFCYQLTKPSPSSIPPLSNNFKSLICYVTEDDGKPS